MNAQEPGSDPEWKHHGVRVVHAHELDPGGVPQTQGMSRAAAINFARVGAEKIWAGTVQFASKPAAGKFRLLIEEHEFISANYTEVEHGIVQQPGRLVYAEIFTLDNALVTE